MVDLQVGNVLRYPVQLRALRYGEAEVPISVEWVDAEDRRLLRPEARPLVVLEKAQLKAPRFVTLHVPRQVMDALLPVEQENLTQTLQIATRLWGLEDEVLVAVRRNYPPVLTEPVRPPQPTVEQALEQHPFLDLSEREGYLQLRSGTWDVQGDLLLPQGYGLWADEAVTLRFGQGQLLLSSAPLHLDGPQEGSIALLPKEDHWAGIAVLGAGKERPSLLRNVEIRGTSGIQRQGWMTLGGLTFYESAVTLERVKLLDMNADSALNIVRGPCDITACEFGHLVADALRLDWAQGRVTQTLFHDVRGDTVRANSSELLLTDVDLLRVRDRGIVASSGSAVEIRNARVTQAAIAVASQDMSRVTIDGLAVTQASIAGLVAHLEQEKYGTASIEAQNVLFGDRSVRALPQVGSSILLNGERVLPVELDSAALRAQLQARGQIKPLDYRLGSSIRLTGYHVYPSQPKAGSKLYLLLRWETSARLSQDYSVFVHLLNEAGQRVAQRDGMPRDNTFPTSRWPVDTPIEDLRAISLPKDLPAGEHHLYLGMYLYQTGERLPVLGADGQPLPEAAIILDERIEVQ